MKIPSFDEFVKQVNFSALSYDLARFAGDDLKHSSDLFTQDQYNFLTQSYAAMSLALLQSYHEWLFETLQSLPPED